ncbi:MAG TPA: fasciclin domain-containing protein [Acidimicrobiales bacterium]|nr:fasciclin domain-containing protein [Acidimicrobiales bacterium]
MSRLRLPRLLVLTVALALLGAACADDGDDAIVISGQDPALAPRDIVDTAVNAGFGTLVAAVQEAGLEDVLRGDGPFTVFAPTDAAFDALPEGVVGALLELQNRDLLTEILTHHVAEGLVFAADVVATDEIDTVGGGTLEVEVTEEPPASEGGEPTTVVTVDGVAVTDTDILATNGIIHVVDEVIIPPSAEAEIRQIIADLPEVTDLLTTAEAAGDFTTLLAAIDAAGLTSALEGEGPFTVFAPTDGAFDALPSGLVEALIGQPEILESILLFHVVGREFTSDDVSVREVVPTLLEGGNLAIERTGDELVVNGVPVVITDIEATNGVIHVIDAVLVPLSVTLPQPQPQP